MPKLPEAAVGTAMRATAAPSRGEPRAMLWTTCTDPARRSETQSSIDRGQFHANLPLCILLCRGKDPADCPSRLSAQEAPPRRALAFQSPRRRAKRFRTRLRSLVVKGGRQGGCRSPQRALHRASCPDRPLIRTLRRCGLGPQRSAAQRRQRPAHRTSPAPRGHSRARLRPVSPPNPARLLPSVRAMHARGPAASRRRMTASRDTLLPSSPSRKTHHLPFRHPKRLGVMLAAQSPEMPQCPRLPTST